MDPYFAGDADPKVTRIHPAGSPTDFSQLIGITFRPLRNRARRHAEFDRVHPGSPRWPVTRGSSFRGGIRTPTGRRCRADHARSRDLIRSPIAARKALSVALQPKPERPVKCPPGHEVLKICIVY